MALIDNNGYYKIKNVVYSNNECEPKHIVVDLVCGRFKDDIDTFEVIQVIRVHEDIPEGTNLVHLAYELLKKGNPNFQNFEYEEGDE